MNYLFKAAFAISFIFIITANVYFYSSAIKPHVDCFKAHKKQIKGLYLSGISNAYVYDREIVLSFRGYEKPVKCKADEKGNFVKIL